MRFQPLLHGVLKPVLENDEMSHLTWLIGNRMVDRADFERHTFCDGFLQPTPKLQLHKKVTADKTLGPLGVMITKDADEKEAKVVAKKVVEKHKEGENGQTLVVLNTVKRARAVYSAIKNESGAPKNVLLIHSRFRPYERSGAHDKDGKVERSGRGPAAVTLLHPGTSDLHSFEYRRSRNRRNDDGWNRAHGFFRLEFENEILGPLSLGYASHYGMGHFRPV